MTEHTETSADGGVLDWLWLGAAIVAVVGGLIAYYWLNTMPAALRFAAVLAGVALGAGTFARTSWGRAAWQFALGSRVELRKMVWPTVPDTRKTTLIVALFVTVLGVFFWLVDMVLSWGTRHLLGTGA